MVFVAMQLLYVQPFSSCEDTICSEIDERKRQLQGTEFKGSDLSYQYVCYY